MGALDNGLPSEMARPLQEQNTPKAHTRVQRFLFGSAGAMGLFFCYFTLLDSSRGWLRYLTLFEGRGDSKCDLI